MKFFVIIVLCLGVFSCVRTDEYLESLNSPPMLALKSLNEYNPDDMQLSGDLKTLTANLKLTTDTSSTTFFLPIGLKMGDINQNLKEIFLENGAPLKLVYNRKLYHKGVKIPINRDNEILGLSIICYEAGFFQSKLVIVDGFNVRASIDLNVNVIFNKLPVAKLEVRKISIDGEYQFNATSSYDGDASVQGAIFKYIYEINGLDKFETVNPIINYFFPNLGLNTVKCWVMDNDANLSEPVVISINV